MRAALVTSEEEEDYAPRGTCGTQNAKLCQAYSVYKQWAPLAVNVPLLIPSNAELIFKAYAKP